MQQQLDNVRAVEIANLPEWGIVYVIVTGAANVRLGDNPSILKADPNDGILLTNATPPQSSFVWWKGRLFGLSDAPVKVSIQMPGHRGQGTS